MYAFEFKSTHDSIGILYFVQIRSAAMHSAFLVKPDPRPYIQPFWSNQIRDRTFSLLNQVPGFKLNLCADLPSADKDM